MCVCVTTCDNIHTHALLNTNESFDTIKRLNIKLVAVYVVLFDIVRFVLCVFGVLISLYSVSSGTCGGSDVFVYTPFRGSSGNPTTNK